MLNDANDSKWVDIHCHILPGFDDGAFCLKEAIHMAKLAERSGITTIIATPHHANGVYECKAEAVKSAVSELNAHLREAEVRVIILPGQEIRVHSELLYGLQSGDILTLNETSYILLELPTMHVPEYLEEMLYELSLRRLVPVIAHPERNAVLLRDHKRILRYRELGALLQITAQSVTGLFGKKIQKFAMALCKENLVHFVASDAHNTTTRTGQLAVAYAFLHERLGPDYPVYYQYNSLCLIQNESMQSLPPRRRSRWLFPRMSHLAESQSEQRDL
jgi:protein-tyrosine phosphatase